MEEDYQTLRARWAAGCRSREEALQLLFLAWWHWAEPDFLTGLSDDPAAVDLWHEIFGFFEGESSKDAEFLFVASIMACVTPFVFGDEAAWTAAAERMMARALSLGSDAFSPKVFEGRSEYGEYLRINRVDTAFSTERPLLGRKRTSHNRLSYRPALAQEHEDDWLTAIRSFTPV